MQTTHRFLATSALAAGALALTFGSARAGSPSPIISPPYSFSIFATSNPGTGPSNYSDPDSVTFNSRFVYVGYGNGGQPDGSGGAKSTIVEYPINGGSPTRTFIVVGHNDGLRIDPSGRNLWAVQNEDANPNVAIINLANGRQTIYDFTSPTAHGGGFDDIDFLDGRIYLSASNPANNPNTEQAIVSAQFPLFSHKAKVTPLLLADATAINVTNGQMQTLNLQDPDSMAVDPFGELVLDSQADGELIVVRNPGCPNQTALVAPLSVPDSFGLGTMPNADDTQFATSSQGRFLVADKDAQTVYSITAPYFAPGQALTAVQDAQTSDGYVAVLDLTSGGLTPIMVGMENPGGIAFIPAGNNPTDASSGAGQLPILRCK